MISCFWHLVRPSGDHALPADHPVQLLKSLFGSSSRTYKRKISSLVMNGFAIVVSHMMSKVNTKSRKSFEPYICFKYFQVVLSGHRPKYGCMHAPK